METQGIYKAMAGIIMEIGHISKDKTCSGGGNYKYRGIDDVYNTINPLMGKYGVFVLPTAQERSCEERKTKSGSVNYVIMRMTYRFCHEDGSFVECSTVGEAMDFGDKGTNKAMSIAMKYALFQIFCIPTEETDDPDAVSEPFLSREKEEKIKLAETRQQARAANPNPPTDKQRAKFFAIMKQRHGDSREASLAELSNFFGRTISSSNELTREDMAQFLDAVTVDMEVA